MAPSLWLASGSASQDNDHLTDPLSNLRRLDKRAAPITKPQHPDGLILESWAQGFMVGALVIMAAITIANMRRGVLLHKLILLELILGTFHGTFMFAHEPAYGWYLSTTAIFLNMSWSLHNVIAWLKTKPFLTRKWSLFYIGTVILAQPYWVLEIYANFTYFNNINTLFQHTRPYEALFRDPWWVFSTLNLLYNIRTSYHLPILSIIRISPRFAVLLVAMSLSIAFIIVDIVAVTSALSSVLPDGLNPFWKMAFVFKCLTDSIVLDDFKTALDRLMRFKMQKDAFGSVEGTLGATCGSSSALDAGVVDWAGPKSGSGAIGAVTGSEVERSKTDFPRTHASSATSPQIPRSRHGEPTTNGTEDPLGEETMENERYDLDPISTRDTQTTAGLTDPLTLPRHNERGPRGGQLSFWDALREGEDLERNASGGGGRGGLLKEKEKHKAITTTKNISHWDDLDLPAFSTETETETGSASSSSTSDAQKGSKGG